MRSLFILFWGICLLGLSTSSQGQTTYTFSGVGDWSNTALWTPSYPASPLPSGDAIIITGTCNLDINRQIGSGASMKVSAGDTLIVATSHSLVIYGELTNDGLITNNNSFYIENGGTFVNSATGTVVSGDGNADDMVNRVGGTFTNNGVVSVDFGTFINRDTFWNNKDFFIASGADFNNADNGTTFFENNGTISVDGLLATRRPMINNSLMDFSTTGELEVRNNFDLINNGIIKSGGIITIINGDLVNNDQIEITGTGTATIQGGDALVNNSGGKLVEDGSLTIENNGSLTINGGSTLMGVGNITVKTNALFPMNGTLAPGNSPGTLTISGDLTIGGSLDVELGGYSSFDILNVSGNLDISAATLNVSLINGFVPIPVNLFEIITFGGTLTGPTFSSVNLPGTTGAMVVIYNGLLGNITLSIVAALPVTWLDFQASITDGRSVFLTWSTASESNNEGFDVQRSADGKDWETIGFVPGTGTTSEVHSYDYTDSSPFTLHSSLAYYRLMQRDIDGATDYSPIRVVQLTGAQGGIRVYPNPTDEEVTISFAEQTDVRGTVQLFNQNGRKVGEYAIPPGTVDYQVRVAQLASGTYLLKVKVGTKEWTKRLVVE